MPSQPVRVALDLETTGLNADADSIIEIGAVKFAGDEVIDKLDTLVAPATPLPYRIQRLTGISFAQVRRAPPLATVLGRLRAFVGGAPLVGHNVAFDADFLRRVGLVARNPLLDTYELASMLLPTLPNYTLASVGAALGLHSDEHHRALADADLARRVFLALLARLEDLDESTLEALDRLPTPPEWTPSFLVRKELQARRGTARVSGFGGGLSLNLGETFASKLGVNPAVLMLARAATAQPHSGTSASTLDPSAVVASPQAPDNGHRAAVAARLAPALAEGGALLLEAEHGREGLLALVEPVLRHAAESNGRAMIVAADAEAMRHLAREIIPAALSGLGADAAGLAVAELAEREAYLCLWRWFGAARTPNGPPLPREIARGLTKLTIWARETSSGMRADVAIAGQEQPAWERVRAGREFSDSAATCPYGTGGYCFLTQAQDAAGKARVVVTTHSALAAMLAGTDTLLPEAARVLILDAHLIEEELRRARGFALDRQELLDLLLGLAEAGADGRRAGLLHAAAAHIDPSGQRTHERAWFERIARAERAAREVFSALRAVLAQARATGDRRGGDGAEQRALRLDDDLRRSRGWDDAARAWDGLAREMDAVTRLLREVAREARAADKRLPGSGSGLPLDLLGAARRLEEITRRGWGFFRQDVNQGDHAEDAANVIHWLRVPYPANERVPRPVARGGGRQRRDSAQAGDAAHPQRDAEPPAADVVEIANQPARREDSTDEEDIPALHGAPVQIGALLAPLRAAGRGLILASPALAVSGDFEYMRATLGLPEGTPGFCLAPDRERQTLLCLPGDVPEPNAPHYQRTLDEALIALAGALNGRLIVIFPSHAALRASYGGIRRALEDKDILVLAQGQDGSARQLWSTFSTENRIVLLGAGAFWDGSTGRGRAPACVVVTRLPFPALGDPLLGARAETWDDPQAQFVVPHAALRLRQALAGLAWSHTDRNAVVLFDRRLQTRGYGPTVLGTLPRCAQHQEPVATLVERIAEWVGPA